jgi:hypothetical protein
MGQFSKLDCLSLSEKGRMGQGVDAEIAMLSTERMVEETIVAGETVYYGGENHVR